VQQETARLLYVATTRARHTLVLAFDEEIFARQNGELQNGAQLKSLLGDNQINRPHFDVLSAETSACAEASKLTELSAAAVQTETEKPSPIDVNKLKLARKRAASFVRKFNPSGYDEEVVRTSADKTNEEPLPIPVARSTSDTPATLYGRWWHNFVQQIPWRADAQLWDAAFSAARARSPEITRSEREWKSFRARASNLADFPAEFVDDSTIVHTEMPFLWRMDEGRCLEGIVDLALFDPGKKKWFVLDWKTNRITPDKINNLRARYLPQMAAYWRAVGELTGAKIEAAIYSTWAGQLIQYDEPDLTKEWERLRTLSPTEFCGAIKESDS
jgi:ATP-dependent helicase/nuclease subunit A